MKLWDLVTWNIRRIFLEIRTANFIRGEKKLTRLSDKEKMALDEAKNKIRAVFPVENFIIFGSSARNEATPESDLDLLLITDSLISQLEKYRISDLVCEVNLTYDTNISILIVDKDNWNTGYWSVLPIKQEVLRDGIGL